MLRHRTTPNTRVYKPITKKGLLAVITNVLLTLPILAYFLPMLLADKDVLLAGDFDMQVQMTEAARISLAVFHQFPFWNPWVSGGVPLYADPQFGLFTPQTVLSLIFGSVVAWKATIVLYHVAGFFSMRSLLNKLGPKGKSTILASLLAYAWVLNGFFAVRSSGHFTFLLYLLLPLLLLWAIQVQIRKYFILFVLLCAYLINAALHYSTIMMLVVALAVIVALDGVEFVLGYRKQKQRLSLAFRRTALLGLALLLAGIMSLPRVILSKGYIETNGSKRTTLSEPYVGIMYGIDSLTKTPSEVRASSVSAFPPGEANANTTSIVFVLFLVSLLLVAVLRFVGLGKISDTYIPAIPPLFLPVILLGIVCFGIGLGGTAFSIWRSLPIFDSTRVSTRFFVLVAFSILVLCFLCIRVLQGWKIVGWYYYISSVTLIAVACGILFRHGFSDRSSLWSETSTWVHKTSQNVAYDMPPHQELLWQSDERSHNFSLTLATMHNKGQIIADNALVDTRVVPTSRCDEDVKGCAYVLSDNARVEKWSPNQVVLRRTGPGRIILNSNIASAWRVNKTYPYRFEKTVEPGGSFTLPDDPTTYYFLTYNPIKKVISGKL